MYNPYGYPAGYGPQGPQFGQFMPGPMNNPISYQNPAQTAVQPQTQTSAPVVLQVATVKQVEQAPVQPGGKALVLVANEPVIAMRTADSMGLTTTDYYHIERFDPDAAAASPSGNWVTHEELQQAIAVLMQQIQQAAPVANGKEAAKK